MEQSYKSVSALVNDSRFIQWVTAGNPPDTVFWENWQRQNPEKAALFLEARDIVISLAEDSDCLTAIEQNQLWEAIQLRRNRSIQPPLLIAKKEPRSAFLLGTWQRRAASFAALLLVAALMVHALWNPTQQYQTAYGETQTVVLPDGSTVILNAHSSLRYQGQWKKTPIREVWLEGEAYFNVTHTQTHTPFLVHTADLTVEVLGTSFNVWKRSGQTRVVLNTGVIKLRTSDQDKALVMKPGESVAYSTENRKLEQQQVNPTQYSAWTQKKWILKDTSLRQVAQLINETFGKEVVIGNEEIADEQMTGVVPTDDLQKLLQGLAHIYELEVIQQEGKILLHKHQAPSE
jgi:ferric-dicitrate binding protein FerR (iron transport regulator)